MLNMIVQAVGIEAVKRVARVLIEVLVKSTSTEIDDKLLELYDSYDKKPMFDLP